MLVPEQIGRYEHWSLIFGFGKGDEGLESAGFVIRYWWRAA